MTSFIGLPGALAEIACPTREDITTDRAVSELVPFSGARIVQLGRRTRRSWSIDWGAEHPRDYAVLDALTRWDTPLVWVGALAQATNLLTPEQAALEDASFADGAGSLRGLITPGGTPVLQWAGGPRGSAVNVTAEKPVPVRAGVPVTVSLWGQRAASDTSVRFAYNFRDSTGAVVQTSTLSGRSTDDLVRLWWTLTPPPGAADMSVLVRDAQVLALPQVTWTSTVMEWAPGRGVHRVVVLPGNETPLVAHNRQVLTQAAYSILEVG